MSHQIQVVTVEPKHFPIIDKLDWSSVRHIKCQTHLENIPMYKDQWIPYITSLLLCCPNLIKVTVWAHFTSDYQRKFIHTIVQSSKLQSLNLRIYNLEKDSFKSLVNHLPANLQSLTFQSSHSLRDLFKNISHVHKLVLYKKLTATEVIALANFVVRNRKLKALKLYYQPSIQEIDRTFRPYIWMFLAFGQMKAKKQIKIIRNMFRIYHAEFTLPESNYLLQQLLQSKVEHLHVPILQQMNVENPNDRLSLSSDLKQFVLQNTQLKSFSFDDIFTLHHDELRPYLHTYPAIIDLIQKFTPLIDIEWTGRICDVITDIQQRKADFVSQYLDRNKLGWSPYNHLNYSRNVRALIESFCLCWSNTESLALLPIEIILLIVTLTV